MSNHGSALRHGAAYLPSLPLDMKANNYEVADAGETITFKGVVKRSLSQAFFLVFVTAMSMATLALVLNIQFNELGTWRFRPFDAVAIGDHFLTDRRSLDQRTPWNRETQLVLPCPCFAVCWNLLLE